MQSACAILSSVVNVKINGGLRHISGLFRKKLKINYQFGNAHIYHKTAKIGGLFCVRHVQRKQHADGLIIQKLKKEQSTD